MNSMKKQSINFSYKIFRVNITIYISIKNSPNTYTQLLKLIILLIHYCLANYFFSKTRTNFFISQKNFKLTLKAACMYTLFVVQVAVPKNTIVSQLAFVTLHIAIVEDCIVYTACFCYPIYFNC